MQLSIRLKSFVIIGLMLSTTGALGALAFLGSRATSESIVEIRENSSLLSSISDLDGKIAFVRRIKNLMVEGVSPPADIELQRLEREIDAGIDELRDLPGLETEERKAIEQIESLYRRADDVTDKGILESEALRKAASSLAMKNFAEVTELLSVAGQKEPLQTGANLRHLWAQLGQRINALGQKFVLSQSEAGQSLRTEIAADFKFVESTLVEIAKAMPENGSPQSLSKFRTAFDQLRTEIESHQQRLIAFEQFASNEMRAASKILDETLNAFIDRCFEETDALNLEVTGIASSSESTVITCAIIAAIIGALSLVTFLRTVIAPINTSVKAMEALSQGDADLARRLPETGDLELKRLAVAFNRFVAGIGEEMRQITGHSKKVAAIVQQVTELGGRLTETSESTKSRANAASNQASEVDVSMQSISAAIEEMSASISEIAGHSSNSQDLSHRVATMANDASAQIRRLGASSTEIGEVVRVITSIAEQTNLLALNATIESARAGDAGKGFAVVANEVKELAKSTAEATGDIGRKVEAIQADTQGAIEVIERIAGMIDQVTEAATTIAAAVQEQSATSSEISQSVHRAAQGTNGILADTREVTEAADLASQCRDDLLVAAKELSGSSSALQSVVGRYRL